MLKSLVNIEELSVQKSLDNILENDFWFDDYIETNQEVHGYNIMKTSPVILPYVVVYITRKDSKQNKPASPTLK